MSLLLIVQNVLNSARAAGRESAARLLPQHDFRRLILKERDRACRNNTAFSLVLIETGDLGRRSAHPPDVEAIVRRLRNVDEIGWFDDERLGILLPYTTREGAHQMIERLRGPLKRAGGIHCDIYTFPDNRLFETGEA